MTTVVVVFRLLTAASVADLYRFCFFAGFCGNAVRTVPLLTATAAAVSTIAPSLR